MDKKEFRKKEREYKINKALLYIVLYIAVSSVSIYLFMGKNILNNQVIFNAVMCITALMVIGIKNNDKNYIEDQLTYTKEKLGKVIYKKKERKILKIYLQSISYALLIYGIAKSLIIILNLREGSRVDFIEIFFTLVILVCTIVDFRIYKFNYKDYRNTLYENGLICSEGNVLLYNEAIDVEIYEYGLLGSSVHIYGKEYFTKREDVVSVDIDINDIDEVEKIFQDMCEYNFD